MKIVRYRDQTSGAPCYGVVEGDTVLAMEGTPFGEHHVTRVARPLASLHLLAPCEPSKILCGGLNYVGHAKETGQAIPKTPPLWLKAPTALIGHGEAIECPPETHRLEFEGELAVVVKRRMRRTPPSEVMAHLMGFTCGNDVTARDIQVESPINLSHSKTFDTFCPLGPWMVTDLDPNAIDLMVKVNGKVRQQTNTSDMIFSVKEMVSFFSHVMTLLPGDVILTGTPAGIGRMEIGETVEVIIEGIGTLSNPIVKADADIYSKAA